MIRSDRFTLLVNPRHGVPGINVLPVQGFRRAKAAITTWPGYAPTPLRDLPDLAADAGIATLRLKDESERFGLGSFKALGGAYAVAKLLAGTLTGQNITRSVDHAALASGRYAAHTTTLTVTSATDGNHGRAVAWAAQRFQCRCVIFVHETVSQGRIDAIARYGARVIRVSGTYDDAVREAERQANLNQWFVISDTSYPGYLEVPRDVMQGYRLMPDEAADQWTGPPPTHVFIQAGVGGVAAAVSAHMRLRFNIVPKIVIVEPERAACLLASAQAGAASAMSGNLDTIMAGLACGEPSLLAWQELDRSADAFMSIPDQEAVMAVQRLAAGGMPIGESGVAGLAGLLAAAADHNARTELCLTTESRVLLFGTEGITDPCVYDKVLRTPPG